MDETKIKIVIADDNNDFTYILKEYLGFNEKFKVVGVAQNGIEAIDYITNYDVDLLLLDIIMPALNGIQVLEKLHDMQRNKVPRTIVLSAASTAALSKQALNLGAEYFVMKPYDMLKLEALINKMFTDNCHDSLAR